MRDASGHTEHTDSERGAQSLPLASRPPMSSTTGFVEARDDAAQREPLSLRHRAFLAYKQREREERVAQERRALEERDRRTAIMIGALRTTLGVLSAQAFTIEPAVAGDDDGLRFVAIAEVDGLRLAVDGHGVVHVLATCQRRDCNDGEEPVTAVVRDLADLGQTLAAWEKNAPVHNYPCVKDPADR